MLIYLLWQFAVCAGLGAHELTPLSDCFVLSAEVHLKAGSPSLEGSCRPATPNFQSYPIELSLLHL